MIFVNTRHSSERIRAWLKGWGFESVFYHAGMGLEERVGLEADLRKREIGGQAIWVVATSAFGMGMDYPFLSRCILFEPSFTLLSLAQALGRVGRAGASAQARVLWHEDDFLRHSWLAQDSERNRLDFEEVREWCQSEECPRLALERYFHPSHLS
jgi:ATP-dependent DNA helicase RecQ